MSPVPSRESRVALALPGGNQTTPCRICRADADLRIYPNGIGRKPEYAYCGKCVNDAMERTEVYGR